MPMKMLYNVKMTRKKGQTSLCVSFSRGKLGFFDHKLRKQQNKFEDNINEQFATKLIQLKTLYNYKYLRNNLSHIHLVNKIKQLNLELPFPNIFIG